MGFSYAPSATQIRTGAERATLVRRTYGLVFSSILVTMLGFVFAASQEAVLDAVIRNRLLMFFVMFIPLIMVQRSARVYPKNLILTFLFTFLEGIYIAPFLLLAERSAPGVVKEAGVLTFAAFGVLTLYATTSRRDFSAWGSFFMVGLVVLIIAMVMNMFIGSASGGLWIASIGVMIFAGLLVFDTWRIVRSNDYGQEDYVLAAVNIYLDLLNMFLFIINLLRRR